VLRLGISHPCGAFDRWRGIHLIDDDRQVIGMVRPVL
jgi:D-serine dehydratase